MFKTIVVLCVLYSVFNYTSGHNAREASSEICAENSKCIMKCCSQDKLVEVIRINKKRHRQCSVYNNRTQDISILYQDFHDFTLITGILENNRSSFKNLSLMDSSKLGGFNVYLNAKAEVLLEMPNAYNRWTVIANNKFCYDFYEVSDGDNVILTPRYYIVIDQGGEEETSRTYTEILNVAIMVSCFFFVVVLVVYALLKELRNLCGMILMAYVASLLGAFLLLFVIRIMTHSPVVCLGLTFFIYFFLLASFCWMSVMSYDIWWTFRGYAKARPIHRRGELFKFLMYCLYAWGVPLGMSITMIVLNETDMTHVPWFVTPKIPEMGCFLEGGEKYLYLYIPMLILIVGNWLFYLMTAFNVWRLSRGTSMLDTAAAGTPQAHRQTRQRFLVYLKLSVVMGLNWVLEFVSFKLPNYKLWLVTDLYNILIGLAIFLIFVCKKKILRRLIKRIKELRGSTKSAGVVISRSFSTDSGSSQETQTLQVCSNPKGPGPNYVMQSF